MALAVLVGAGRAAAQQGPPVTLDPSVSRQATNVILAADAATLSPGGQPGASLRIALGRGVHVDPASREQLCSRGSAKSGACPEASRIGFGRFGLNVRGYEPGASDSDLAWAIDAYLGEPQRSGDAASIVLISRLLGADLVGALLAPSLRTTVPATTTTIGRLVRRASGRYGVELRFDALPARLAVSPPITATPSSFELSLGAIRRTRQDFVRRFKIRTPTGYEVRRVHDHRLVGHYLFRTPARCRGSWPVEMTVGVGSGVKRTSAQVPCTSTATAAPASVQR